jgi:hypothetical protein
VFLKICALVLGVGVGVEGVMCCFYLQGIFALNRKVAISPENMASIYENKGCHMQEGFSLHGYGNLFE